MNTAQTSTLNLQVLHILHLRQAGAKAQQRRGNRFAAAHLRFQGLGFGGFRVLGLGLKV